MKYIVSKGKISNEEIIARQKYIYELFHLYTFVDSKESNDKVAIINSIPTNCLDLLIIIGHDCTTDSYLLNNYNKIKEKNIVIISCNIKDFKSLNFMNDKRIYVPKNLETINCYSGKKYNFGFNITDEELLMYRKRNKGINYILETTYNRRDVNGPTD